PPSHSHPSLLSLHDALPISVTLSISGLPTGVTASVFTPNPVTPASPAATSTFTLTAAATAPVVSSVIVTITGAPLGKTTTFTLKDRKSTRLNSSHVSISYAV